MVLASKMRKLRMWDGLRIMAFAKKPLHLGKVDPESAFFEEIVDNVMGLAAYPEDDEGTEN